MYESQQMDRVCNILLQRAVILVEDWQQYLTVTIRTPSSPLVYIMQRNKIFYMNFVGYKPLNWKSFIKIYHPKL